MGKTSGNRFLEQLGERVFHIFPKLHPIRGVTPAPLIQFSLDHVTIISSSPMDW